MAGMPLVAPENRPGNVNFHKVYNRAEDKDVAVVVLDVNGTTLCTDGHYALTAKEVSDCCEQGCVVQNAGGFYRPVFWKMMATLSRLCASTIAEVAIRSPRRSSLLTRRTKIQNGKILRKNRLCCYD